MAFVCFTNYMAEIVYPAENEFYLQNFRKQHDYEKANHKESFQTRM